MPEDSNPPLYAPTFILLSHSPRQLRIWWVNCFEHTRVSFGECQSLILMERIDKAGAGFRSLTESIDTTTPAGRMMMQMVGAFPEFEREMIRERTQAGLQAARAAGRTGGRPPKLTKQQRQDIADNVLSGRKSGADMARLYSISETTVSRIVSRARQAGVPG